jgi:hypothetical protein
MLADFKPEPLLPSSEKYNSMLPIEPVIVNGYVGCVCCSPRSCSHFRPPTSTILVGDKVCLNLATTNFLGFSTNPEIKVVCLSHRLFSLIALLGRSEESSPKIRLRRLRSSWFLRHYW